MERSTLLNLQIEPILRKRLNLDTPHPLLEVKRLRKVVLQSCQTTTPRSPLWNILSSTSTSTPDLIHTLNQTLATITATTPLRFISTPSGNTPLHCLLQNTAFPTNLLHRAAQQLLSQDPTAAATFNHQKQLPLHTLLVAHEPPYSTLHSVIELLLHHYPAATEIAAEGVLPIEQLDVVLFQSNTLSHLLQPSHPRPPNPEQRTTIFDIVQSPHYIPLLSLHRHIQQFPHSVYDSHNGYFPLEAMLLFGKPTVDTILLLFSKHPAAAVSSTSMGSLLHLLLGSSRSTPSYTIVQCLCSIDPTAMLRKNNANKTCTELLALREKKMLARQRRKKKRTKKVLHLQHKDMLEMRVLIDYGCALFQEWKKELNAVPSLFHVIQQRVPLEKQQAHAAVVHRLCTIEMNTVVQKQQQLVVVAAVPEEAAHTKGTTEEDSNLTEQPMLCVNAMGQSSLHVLCGRTDVECNETLLATMIQQLPHEMMREDLTGSTPLDLLFSMGRPTLLIVQALVHCMPQLQSELAMLLFAFHRDHANYASIMNFLIPSTTKDVGAGTATTKTWAAQVRETIVQLKKVHEFTHYQQLEVELVCGKKYFRSCVFCFVPAQNQGVKFLVKIFLKSEI